MQNLAMRNIVIKFICAVLLGAAFFTFKNQIRAQETQTVAPTAGKIEKTTEDSTANDTGLGVGANDLLKNAQDKTRRYRIGVGDELDIHIFRHPELSQTVRVNEFGVIMMPRVDDPIQAVCKTENELSSEIIKYYSKYLRQPFVRVFVKEYKSQPVAVIGAVGKPGQFNVSRKMRLLEALAVAGGPTDKAGAKISLARLGSANFCEQTTVAESENRDLSKLLYSFELKKTLEGNEAANPWMQPGDIVTVLEADKAFVVGNVKEPKAIELKTSRTLTQAIAEAGGILEATKKKEIFLIREDNAGNKVKTPLNLVAINQGKAEDPVLKPNDIIEVPQDGAKVARNSVIKALSGGLTNLPFLIF